MADADQAGTAFREGRLDDAVAAASAAVKAKPTDLAARVRLAEMLLLAGNLERADVLLDSAGQLDPSASLIVAEFRQLLRADMARRQLFRDGRVPEFLDTPSSAEQHLLACLVAMRAGDYPAAAEAATAAEAARAVTPGIHEGGPAGHVTFDDFRDASDDLGGVLEILTTTGKYYWIPLSRIDEITFHKPMRPRDLAWRRASISVNQGPDGDVYVPATYFSDDAARGAALGAAYRLGRATDWLDHDGVVTGVGQREFLVGDASVPIMELSTLRFGPK